MTLMKFKRKRPWLTEELGDFFNGDTLLEDVFGNKGVMSQPALNIREEEGLYELELAAPGLSKEEFSITIDKGVLTIAAEKKEEQEEKKENYTRKEFNYRSFSRSVMLPEDAREDCIKAVYEDGVLRVRIVKRELVEKQRPQKVRVE